MGETYKRANDEKIEELIKLLYDSLQREAERDKKINEIHQRQTEQTIPMIEKLDKRIFGNGKKGLCDEVNEIKSAISLLDNAFRWLKFYMTFSISALVLLFVILKFVMKV